MDNSVGQIGGVKAAPNTEAEKKKLKQSCEEFEAVMTGYLLKTMHETIIKGEEPDQARQTYESMMDEALARESSRNSGLGLGKILYEQLVPKIKTDPNKS